MAYLAFMYWRSRLPTSRRIQRILYRVVGLQGRPFHGVVLFCDTHKHPFVTLQLFLHSVGFASCLKLGSVGMANDSRSQSKLNCCVPDSIVKIFPTEQGRPSERKPTSLWGCTFLACVLLHP